MAELVGEFSYVLKLHPLNFAEVEEYVRASGEFFIDGHYTVEEGGTPKRAFLMTLEGMAIAILPDDEQAWRSEENLDVLFTMVVHVMHDTPKARGLIVPGLVRLTKSTFG